MLLVFAGLLVGCDRTPERKHSNAEREFVGVWQAKEWFSGLYEPPAESVKTNAKRTILELKEDGTYTTTYYSDDQRLNPAVSIEGDWSFDGTAVTLRSKRETTYQRGKKSEVDAVGAKHRLVYIPDGKILRPEAGDTAYGLVNFTKMTP